MRTHAEGEHLASYLAGPPLNEQDRPLVGADMQPITPLTCLEERGRSRCIPSFVEVLTDFGLDAAVPPPKTIAAPEPS